MSTFENTVSLGTLYAKSLPDSRATVAKTNMKIASFAMISQPFFHQDIVENRLRQENRIRGRGGAEISQLWPNKLLNQDKNVTKSRENGSRLVC